MNTSSTTIPEIVKCDDAKMFRIIFISILFLQVKTVTAVRPEKRRSQRNKAVATLKSSKFLNRNDSDESEDDSSLENSELFDPNKKNFFDTLSSDEHN